MKLKKYGILLATLGLLGSCANDSSEGLKGMQSGVKGSGVFMSFNIDSYGRTRDIVGTDEGTADEASLENVVLVLAADETTKPLLVQKLSKESITSNKVVHELTNEQLEAVSNYRGEKVKVFVVCNLPEDVDYEGYLTSGSFTTVQNTLELSGDADTYWGDTFLMSNSDRDNERLIDIEGIKRGRYDSEENAWELGTINVQRAMARLDINNQQPKVEEAGYVNIHFDGVALVNLSKQFYLYKQVDNILMGKEESDKFVDDPKSSKEVYTSSELDYFNLQAQELSFSDSWFADEQIGETPVYEKWRYVTPNTVSKIEDQVNGKTTGIVYRAEMTPKNGSFIHDASKGNDLYVYGGIPRGSLADIQAAVADPQGDDQQLLKFVYNSVTEGLTTDEEIIGALKEAGFYVYPQKDGKYYCYYYYWVRHNATPATYNDGKMDVMEFGIVRNNIYQIAVTSVAGLGNPGDFVPDPTTPDDPEKPNVEANIAVSVTVVPWTVRRDNIYF